MDLTPRQIVAELDKYIVGQDAAKKAVAVAIRKIEKGHSISGRLLERCAAADESREELRRHRRG